MFTLFGSSSNADKDSSAEVIVSISSWCVCSIGMMVFNKVAVQQFPAACLEVHSHRISLWCPPLVHGDAFFLRNAADLSAGLEECTHVVGCGAPLLLSNRGLGHWKFLSTTHQGECRHVGLDLSHARRQRNVCLANASWRIGWSGLGSPQCFLCCGWPSASTLDVVCWSTTSRHVENRCDGPEQSPGPPSNIVVRSADTGMEGPSTSWELHSSKLLLDRCQLRCWCGNQLHGNLGTKSH